MFIEILSSLKHSFFGTILLLVQVAFTFAVLVNVYAMVDAYRAQIIRDSGYQDEDSLLGVSVRPYGSRASAEQGGDWRNQIEIDMGIMKSVLGIVDVSMAHEGIPFQSNLHVNNFDRFRADSDLSEGVPVTRYSADLNTVDLLGLEIIEGRNFTPGEVNWVDSIKNAGGPALITQTVARALFPDESAVNQTVINQSGHRMTVVGVIRTAQAVYWAPYDEYSGFVAGKAQFNEGYIVRLDRSLAADADFAAVKGDAMRELSSRLLDEDPDRQVVVETFEDMKKLNLGRFIIINSIVGGVAVLLVLVTALGNYGQVSYTLLKRTKQIGIRRALGANRGYIFRFFLLENLLTVAIGLVIGLLLMLGLNFAIVQAVGYGKIESIHVIVSALFLCVLSALSALVPLMSATQTSPAVATRTV